MQTHVVHPEPDLVAKVDGRPEVKVFVVQRNVELASFGADLSLVLVALTGSSQSVATLDEFQAHLSSRYQVSVSAARGLVAREHQQDDHSDAAVQGVTMAMQVVHTEPEIAVHRCSEVQRWDFDPMLFEVEACVTQKPPQTDVPEVARLVDLCLSGLGLSGPDVCSSGQTSPGPSLLESEQPGGSPPPIQVDFLGHQDGGAPVATTATSTEDFIAAFKKPLSTPILSSPPRLRRTRAARARAGELDDSKLIPQEER
jgi:hypothetical protein